MANQKDRHLEAPGEANRDKHINFLAAENGDVDPASENFDDTDEKNDKESGDDNGFFTDDNSTLQTKEEYEEDKGNLPGKNEKITPLEFDNSPTLADKITVDSANEDILTPVVDDNETKTNVKEDK